MPSKPPPLSAFIVLCERVLNETDSIVSAIRIADVLAVHVPPGANPESHAVIAHVLAMCKFSYDDESTRVIALRLRRPDGTEKDVDFGRPLETKLKDIKTTITAVPR